MKRLLKCWTFWVLLDGILVVVYNLAGHDDKNIIMIGLNPGLNMLSSSDACTTIADVPYLWHLLSIISMTCYGLLLDGVRKCWDRKAAV